MIQTLKLLIVVRLNIKNKRAIILCITTVKSLISKIVFHSNIHSNLVIFTPLLAKPPSDLYKAEGMLLT